MYLTVILSSMLCMTHVNTLLSTVCIANLAYARKKTTLYSNQSNLVHYLPSQNVSFQNQPKHPWHSELVSAAGQSTAVKDKTIG